MEVERAVRAERTFCWMSRFSSVWECGCSEDEVEVARHSSAACVSPIFSNSNVLRIHISSISASVVAGSGSKVARCRLAVSNSPISTSSPATLMPKSLNLLFHILNASSSFSLLAFCANVLHSEDKAYKPMIALLCASAVPKT